MSFNWQRPGHVRRHRFRDDNFQGESDYVRPAPRRVKTLEEELDGAPASRPLDESVRARIHTIAQKLARKRNGIIDL